MVNAPFRECVVLSLASFRKRGSSLSGDPCLWYVGGSVARGFIFLSVLLFYPTFSVVLLCSRQSILWRSKLRADPVLVFFLNGQSVLYDAVAMHFVLCFFLVVRPERLGIMAGMDQEAWLLVFDAFPSRGAPLGTQAPDARHHGRFGPQDSVEFHRCSSWARFSPCPLLSYVCLGHGHPQALCSRDLWLIRVWRYSGCLVSWCSTTQRISVFSRITRSSLCVSPLFSRLPSHSSGVLCGIVSLFFLQFLLEEASPQLQFFTVVDFL